MMRNPNFFIYISKVFSNKKIVLGLFERKHLTIHFGTKSKYVDIHIKDELEQDKNNAYDTIIKISHFSLIRLYLILKSEIENQIKLSFSNTINKGKLKKNHCILYPITSENNNRFFSINNHRTKIKIRKNIDLVHIESMFCEVDNLDIKDGVFLCYKIKQNNLIKNGIVFRKFNVVTSDSFIYLSERKLKELKYKLFEIFIDGLSKIKDVDSTRLLKYKK